MTAGFDEVASAYQRLWTKTAAGQLQREAVWRHAGGLFPRGSHVLDLGCGTGDDALLLQEHGVKVTGVDLSAEMVRTARRRGVDAHVRSATDIGGLNDSFDGVISNFGALNCVPQLQDLREPLVRLVRPEGWLVLCLMSRVCLWETAWYAMRGEFGRATRRWSGEATSSLAPRVFYPTVSAIRRAFEPAFTLEESHGIGVAVPPSFVRGLSDHAIQRLGRIDEYIASLPAIRALGDHRLLIFRRGAKP